LGIPDAGRTAWTKDGTAMKKRNSTSRTRKRANHPKRTEERELIATLASRRFEDETRRMLGTHYANKYGVRRGR
jgi:hypothetical protein